MARLPPIVQASLDAFRGAQQYAEGLISEDEMRQLATNQFTSTAQLAPQAIYGNIPQTQQELEAARGGSMLPPELRTPQFDISVSDFTAQDQRLVTELANKMGLARAPAGVINGQVVDLNGNPIPGAPSADEYTQMLHGLRAGSLSIADVARRTNVQGQPIGTPLTGLVGSEQALTGGLQGATDAMMTGAGIAREDVATAGQQAQEQLGRGREQVLDAALTANQMAQGTLSQGRQDVIGAAQAALAGGTAPLAGYAQQGQQAAQVQAALSGALGPQAQAQAFANFQKSPGQAFLREQAELGTTRNAAAIGGLGGGRVRQELQRQAMGLAQQDFGNYYNRLAGIAGQGLQAGSQLSGLQGQIGSNLMGQLGGLSGTGAGITGQLGSQAVGQLGSSQQLGAQLAAQQGQNLGNIALQTGANIGQSMLGTGQQLASDRLLTGQQMAQNIGGTSTALANLANQYGLSVSDLLGVAGGNLSNLLSGTGAQVAQGQQTLGTTLGNIAVGQGSQAVGLPSIPGVQQQQSQLPGVLGGIGGLATGAASLLA